jgi:hypothetical protein
MVPGGAAVVGAEVIDPPGSTAIDLDCHLAHQLFEALQPLAKGGIDPDGASIAQALALIGDQRARIADDLFTQLQGTIERIERIRIATETIPGRPELSARERR